MDPPDDHRDVVLAWSARKERRGIGDDRISHLARIECSRAAHGGAEALLPILLTREVLALDDAVGVPDDDVASDEVGGLGLVLRRPIVAEAIATDHQRAELALAIPGAEQIR